MVTRSRNIPDTVEQPQSSVEKPSFFSLLKAFHDNTKLYFSLLGLIMAVVAVPFLMLSKWEIPLLIAVIVCIMPLLLILLWLVPAWREKQHAKIARKFGISGEVKDTEYFRLTPYETASDFRRADKVHGAIYKWLIENPTPLLYLSGVSGSGKSSIISGWVLPQMISMGIPTQVINVRVVGNPISAITEALLKPGAIWDRPPSNGEQNLYPLLEKAARRVANQKLLLVLDQFEEFLILADEDQRASFTALLRALGEHPVPRLQVLMILRSDYRPLLDKLELPEFPHDRKEVPPFFERDAMDFLHASGLQISDALKNDIIEEAREVEQTPGLIRPITVNLFGLVLRRFQKLPKNYQKGTLLRSHLRALIQRREIREFAPKILRCMITANGTKVPVTCADIARVVGLDRYQVRGCLVQLADAGVVRELDRAHAKWEMAHDFIAGLYHQILAGWRESAWRRARPWFIGGGIGLWCVSLLVLPGIIGIFKENQNERALIQLGFSRQSCTQIAGSTPEPDCMAWSASGVDNKAVVAAVPYLAQLKKTRSLTIDGGSFQRVDVLKSLAMLQTLVLSSTQIHSVDALKGLAALQTLNLSGPNIQNIDGLKGLAALQTLYLSGTHIQNIDALKGLAALKTLDLSGTHIQNIDALKGLAALQTLDLRYSNIQNIDALKGLAALQTLYLSGTPVVNVDALKGLKGLQIIR